MPSAPAVCVSAPAAELFFLLAAAFAPPPAGLSARDWCLSLAADLEDLGAELGLDTAVAVGALRECGAGPLAADPWLVPYSGLFLVPPVPVTLNAGLYLEGALAGASAQMLAQCYAAAGFAPRDDFHDLPDHAGLQLEFLGCVMARAREDASSLELAHEFIDSFVVHWSGPLRQACDSASRKSPAAQAYAALAELLQRACVFMAAQRHS